MITERDIDIFSSTMQTITNPVNTVGVMGKGLAKGFKMHFPEIESPYVKACKEGVFKSKGLFSYQTKSYNVLFFPTKGHWAECSKLENINRGLAILSRDYRLYGIESLSLPALGCGLGGLRWEEVRASIYRYFEHHPLEVELIPFK